MEQMSYHLCDTYIQKFCSQFGATHTSDSAAHLVFELVVFAKLIHQSDSVRTLDLV